MNSRNLALFCLALLFPAACKSPESAIRNRSLDAEALIDVYFIPLEFSTGTLAREMCGRLRKELNLNCRVSLGMGTNVWMYHSQSNQWMSPQIAAEALKISQRLDDAKTNAAFIVLTEKDINSPKSGLRWHFAEHYGGRLSVVSFFRMNPATYGEPANPALLRQRLFKMVKRTLGLQLFGYNRNTDLRSIMYSPIMSLDDLDAIGESFFPK